MNFDMCAIAGIFSNKNDGTLYPRAKKLLANMEHRGPDGQSLWTNDFACIGHNRLKITGGDNAFQPIMSNGIVIAVNGEFYDWQETRKHYIEKGYKFKTDSDSEILIPLYLDKGIKGALQKLKGEFAFILYDIRQRQVYAARDQFGIKPLFYRTDFSNNIIEFASEATAFSNKELDINYLCMVLSMQYNYRDISPYKGIYSVLPGNYVSFSTFFDYVSHNVTTTGHIEQRAYCIIPYNFFAEKNMEPCINDIRDILYTAVERRAICDVPLCCHLSGGLDSSAVYGIASEIVGEPIPTFSVVFGDTVGKYDETETIKRTIARKNAESLHHWVKVSQKDILHAFDDAVAAAGGVAINGHISCKYLMNKAIHDAGFKVALTGEGADECFYGYSHIKHEIFDAPIDPMMVGAETPYNDKIGKNEYGPGSYFSRTSGNFCPKFLEAKFSLGKKLWLLMDRVFWRNNYAILRSVDSDFYLYAFSDYMSESAKEFAIKKPLKAAAKMWIKSALPNYILKTLGDGCEMPHSIEGRLPFLDSQLFDYCAQLDEKVHYGDGMLEKKLLREAAKAFVTDEVYKKQKQPFQAPPITRYFDEDDWKLVERKLSSDEFYDMKIFDKFEVVSMLDSVKNGSIQMQTAYEPVVMMLLSINALRKTVG